MSVSNFDELWAHVGHKIVCVQYGIAPAQNVAVECEDCGCVLIDFDREQDPDPDGFMGNHDHCREV